MKDRDNKTGSFKHPSHFASKFLNNIKNTERGYFNQHLECAAPKQWLKYSTHV